MIDKTKKGFNGITIYYANKLARMCSKFTLEEEKVLHLIFSQIKPYEKNDTTVKLSKLDFFDKLELESKDRYSRYRKLVHGLINKTFLEIKELDGTQLMGVIITGSKWYANKPFFEVKLNDWFMPFLEQLVRDYTKIQLDSILKLKSKYSLSLHKWLCSWTDENKIKNQRYLTTKELKELFGLSIDDYVYNGKFQRKLFENYTIKKALLEINSKTNISVEFKKNKKGNKVLNYEFIWIQKEKAVTKSKSTLSKSNLSKNEIEKNLQNIDNY